MKPRRFPLFKQACALIVALACSLASGALVAARSPQNSRSAKSGKLNGASPVTTLDLRDFGAVGDGVADDGPALQSALDALADAGGGTLFVPEGRYAIATPVARDFGGLDAAVTIEGVESLTPVPPPTADGSELTRGLDLVSEFLPRTGEQQVAIRLAGLRSVLVKDIAFVGTPDVLTDAFATLAFSDIQDAIVRHCEFYGLSSFEEGGSIVGAVRSGLKVEQCEFLGSTANSGGYGSVVDNLEWKSIAVTDTVFADYGQRPELFGKLGDAAPHAWIAIGNAAAVTADSPRREAIVRNVFLDEGALNGISSLPERYQPLSAPIDLLYVSGLWMNVSNLETSGHFLSGLQNLLIENSHYGWSENPSVALNIFGARNAILDRVECVAAADTIRADAATSRLVVIDSTYAMLDSLAPDTRVITTTTPDEDPVQYVRAQFESALGRAPDPAAHFYWSDRILDCGDDSPCVAASRAALSSYLAASPTPTFSLTGLITDEEGAPLAGIAVSLSGSQTVTTATDAEGFYRFDGLPTSGVYTLAVAKRHYTFDPQAQTFVTPGADVRADFAATLNRHSISGRLVAPSSAGIAGETVTLSGSRSATATTDADGTFFFGDLPAGGSYTLTPSSTLYTFSPAAQSFDDLDASKFVNFDGTTLFHHISGQIAGNGQAMPGVKVTLSGSRSATATTDANGIYWLTDIPRDGSYTVTPLTLGYVFAPGSKTFNNLSADQGFNFVGTYTTFKISGRVAENGVGVGGVTIAITGSVSSTTTTGANGDYSFNAPASGSYIVTASRAHYTFASASATFNNLSADGTANFSATLDRHKISGRITRANGSAMPGVAVALSGSQSATAMTDASGNYSFASLPTGGNYTVTPSLQFHVFTPSSQSFNDLGGDRFAGFVGGFAIYKIVGRVTEKGAGLAGVTLSLAGSHTQFGPQAGQAVTGADGSYSLDVVAGGDYTTTPSKKNYVFDRAGASFVALEGDRVADFAATLQTIVEFGAASFNASEGAGSVQITLTRTGDTSTAAVVTYSAQDGTAQQGHDLSTALGIVVFAPGETTKSITLFITDDSFVESAESLTLTLDALGTTVIGAQATTSLTINDNDSNAAAANAVDDARFFVRQHYRDFLNREPDAAGLDFWAGQIIACGTDPACLAARRQNVSAAFFLSIEFKETGYLVYRLYKASYGRTPRRAGEFLFDSRIIGDGVVVNAPGWEQKIEANKRDLLAQFVTREEFLAQYPSSLTPAQFVASLNANTGGSLTVHEAAAAATEFGGATDSADAAARQRALLRVAESRAFYDREINPAFVLMQYFGYLQRNPDDAPDDSNLVGFNFWLKKLNDFKGDFAKAEMVRAFIESAEYRGRFGK